MATIAAVAAASFGLICALAVGLGGGGGLYGFAAYVATSGGSFILMLAGRRGPAPRN